MGKVLQFKPQQPGLRLLPRADAQACRKCGHPLAMHVVHPNGILECLTRRCLCRIHRWKR